MKKKVLIITYLWHPMEGVGLIRASKFAKYLPQYGWEPLILTVNLTADRLADGMNSAQGLKVFRTAYKDVVGDIKKFFGGSGGDIGYAGVKTALDPVSAASRKNIAASFVRELIAMPDEQRGWYRFGLKEGRRIIGEEGVDLVFSTSPPETAHLIARGLKRCHRIPWIADLRDLWSDDHFRQRPLFKKAILKLMERGVLGDADALTTVSGPWAERLRKSISNPGGRVHVIENGFDEEDFDRTGYAKNEKLTITYTGKLHKKYQDPAPLFKILRELISEERIDPARIDIKFYIMGYDRPDIKALSARYGLADVVSDFGKVEYDKSLDMQSSSELLLFIQWQGRGGEGWYSAKLYDYIGARRPILAMAKRGSIIDDFITRTASGMTADGERNLKEAVLSYYDEYIKNGHIRYKGNEDEISGHTRRLRARDLAKLFDLILDRGRF